MISNDERIKIERLLHLMEHDTIDIPDEDDDELEEDLAAEEEDVPLLPEKEDLHKECVWLGIGVTCALLGLGFKIVFGWALGTLIAGVAFVRLSLKIAHNKAVWKMGELPRKKRKLLPEQVEHVNVDHSYYWLFFLGMSVAAIGAAMEMLVVWLVGTGVAISGLSRATRLRSEHIERSHAEGDKSGYSKKGRRLHWLFVIGAVTATVSVIFGYLPGFIIGGVLALGSIISDARL